MNNYIDFGIIPNIEDGKDYSCIGGPEAFKTLYSKYNCISIAEDIASKWIDLTDKIQTYRCSLSRNSTGIDLYGVTIIPPKSAEMFADVVESLGGDDDITMRLVGLFRIAYDNNKYVICFGI